MPNVLIAGYDGTSRIPGTSLGALPLWNALAAVAPAAAGWTALAMKEETRSSAIWCRKIYHHAVEQRFTLALGGEHLVTFPLVEALARRHPGLRLVVLDAHHDAYEYPLVTHHSLFHFTARELAVPTLVIGARWQLDQADGCELLSDDELRAHGLGRALERIARFVAGAPFYFSVDLDVLDPALFPAVSMPVPGGLSVAELSALTRAALALGPVAVDVVEYNPFKDDSTQAALGRIRPFFEELAQWMA